MYSRKHFFRLTLERLNKLIMKIAVSYPPIMNQDGQKAMVSQNRNVQFFKRPTYLLPVVHGQAATWLRDLGYEIYWDDGNAQLKNYEQWYADILRWEPGVIIFESTHNQELNLARDTFG